MPKTILTSTFLAFVVCAAYLPGFAGERYKNFRTAIYARAYEVQKMADLNWLRQRFDIMQTHIKIDKIYLETHRDLVMPDEDTLTKVKKFFADRGVETAGGITYTIDESNLFQTFCYSKPEDRQKVKEIAEYTARHFDEIILDDFFFTSCKCEQCIEAKGDKSWTQYRLELMDDSARQLVINPAKKINPKVKVVIKYPNWYEHFQGLGFNLETEPGLFDGLYTGTETRDPVRSNQHLQQYQGYLIFRYFENIKPGGNGGGWVDTGGLRYLDRYAEQLWLTLFAKAPEITLFDFRQLQRPIEPSFRGEWQGHQTSFDFDAMIAPVRKSDGRWPQETTIALAAGYALETVDGVLGQLGNPIGVKSYKPYHSTGEDFLHNYLGMVGIPMDLLPEFPVEANPVFLAETAKFDHAIVDKIKKQLMDGKVVVITSGLLRALQGKGIEDIVELEHTNRKALIKDFVIGRGDVYQAEEEVVIPQIQYLTNDSWEEISSLDAGIGWPVLHRADYGNSILYVLTIPENFGDLYNLPPEVLKRVKQTLMQNIYVRVDGPSKIALFVYDNSTFIVESFRDENAEIRIVTDSRIAALNDLISGNELNQSEKLTAQRVWGRQIGEDKVAFDTTIKPHSYRVFRAQ